MSDKDDRQSEPRVEAADAARKRRLAAALRENLKRRKAQARQRSGQDRVPAAEDD